MAQKMWFGTLPTLTLIEWQVLNGIAENGGLGNSFRLENLPYRRELILGVVLEWVTRGWVSPGDGYGNFALEAKSPLFAVYEETEGDARPRLLPVQR